MIGATEIRRRLESAYSQPGSKFCFYFGGADRGVAEIIGRDRWDWTPQQTVNIEPYFWNTHTLALAFGAEPIFTSEGKEWIKPCIASPSDIRTVAMPDVHSGRTGEILALAGSLLDEYPDDVLIRLPDIQSPLGVAELLMGEQVYYALMTHPSELHDLLEKISEFTVRYVEALRSVLGSRLNACCHPQIWCNHEGYYISDDANSMVSPEMHLEFSVEYINRLTKELGQVIYHTCTWTPIYLDNIRKVKDKKLVNWSVGTSMDPAEVIREKSGKTVLAPHIGKGVHLENGITSLELGLKSEADVIRYYLESMEDDTTMFMQLQESLWDSPEMIREIVGIFDAFGYTPWHEDASPKDSGIGRSEAGPGIRDE